VDETVQFKEKVSDSVRIEVFRYGIDAKDVRRDISGKYRFGYPSAEWRCIGIIPSIERTGFVKDVTNDKGRNNAMWAAGAVAIKNCEVIEVNGGYQLNWHVRWFDHNDDDDFRLVVRYTAIFARK
jgi:hypothetical protein